MTHRKNIRAIDGDATLEEAMEFILDEPFSRFPVYQDSIDNIIGILHIKDAIKYYVKENVRDKAVKDIEGLLQKAYFIPETSKINSIFKNLRFFIWRTPRNCTYITTMTIIRILKHH